MKRREFLQISGCFAATAAIGGVGCGDNLAGPDAGQTPDAGDTGPEVFRFPQGIASGDPQATSVMLWTRVEAESGDTGPIDVVAEVSATDDFAELLVQQTLTVTADSDHTLRLLVDGLTAGTRYFYRFTAGENTSEVGRTLTAPDPSDTSPVRLAWVNCQDYGAGFYAAYRQLVLNDEIAAEDEQIQVVLHVGDFIYETIGGQFQVPIDDAFEPIEDVLDRDGEPRVVDAFPDGGVRGEETFAVSLADYRHLYKQFLRDPDLRAARARWPFVHTWDDHEFTDDCWQTQATYDPTLDLGEPSQTRKVAANQAWFEFVPANLTEPEGVGGVPGEATEFAPMEVKDVEYSEFDDNNLATEPNNVAALGSLTIYRSFQYGANVDLVITDLRSYRSDHPVPESLTVGNPAFFHPRAAIPAVLADTFDAGRTANGGNPPATVLGIPNPRIDSPPGTMLGGPQKAWFKATMVASTATWRLWASSLPMLRLRVNQGSVATLLADRYATTDSWDGYNTERTELLTFLRDGGVRNTVVLSGDLHAQFASVLMDDFNAPTPTPVAVEFTAAGVCSNSLFSFFEFASRGLPGGVREIVTYDSVPLGGDEGFVPNLNTLLYYGTESALAASVTHDLATIEAAADTPNPHMAYCDTDSQGFGVLTVTETDVTARLVTMNRPIADAVDGSGVKTTATFTVAAQGAGEEPALQGPVLTGEPPFPFTAT